MPPIILDGRTLVPIRALAEYLGYEVGWDGEAVTVTSPAQPPQLDPIDSALDDLSVDQLEAIVVALRAENAALLAQLMPGPMVSGVEKIKVGAVFQNDALRLCVTDWSGIPSSMDSTHIFELKYWVEAKATPITVDCNSLVFEFGLVDALLEDELNHLAYGITDSDRWLEPGRRLERVYTYRLKTGNVGLQEIIAYWPSRQYPLVVFVP